MSKNCIISLIIGCFVYSLLSCSESYPYCEDEYDKTWISVYPSSITIDKDELAGSFSVYSNRKWTIYSEPYWLYLSSYSGNGNKSIDFTVSENTGYSNRSGNILIRTDDGAIKEQSIHITQAASTPFTVTMNSTSYGSSSGWQTMSITAASSKSWTISKSDSWVHFGSYSNSLNTYYGTGSGDVRIYVDANTSSYSRNSTLTVKYGINTKDITITQEASNTTSSLEISISNTCFYGHKNDSETLTITTSSSQYWTVSADAYWVSFSKTSGYGSSTVTVYTTANPYSYERYARITVNASSITRIKDIYQLSK